MVEEMNDVLSNLWVHQESVVLGADTHDVWTFTPAFLSEYEIVPGRWRCSSASRTPDDAEINYGPVNWRMTEDQLWISLLPDSSVADRPNSDDAGLIPSLARVYLEKVPHLPFTSMWFYWRASSPHIDLTEWASENLLPCGWPEEFDLTVAQPMLGFASGGHNFQISMSSQAVQRRDQRIDSATVFDCYAFIPARTRPTPEEAINETFNWFDRWQTLQQAISLHLKERD